MRRTQSEKNRDVPYSGTDGEATDMLKVGCMDDAAPNFDSNAKLHNGAMCNYKVGCMDPVARNYDSEAQLHDGTKCDYGDATPTQGEYPSTPQDIHVDGYRDELNGIPRGKKLAMVRRACASACLKQYCKHAQAGARSGSVLRWRVASVRGGVVSQRVLRGMRLRPYSGWLAGLLPPGGANGRGRGH